ncbi:hypothetical protein L1887_01063 [Cichorium endivia]|nr:hypothetical protein L1887_01063 [Cichorium endivia]
MEKQSTSNKFLHAVDCALDEALRRIEFGLSCSCLSKEVYDIIKSQTFVNAGIMKECSTVNGGDNFSTVATFKPANILQSVQDLAREHFDGFNRFQVLSLHTQLFSYYRWKGYHQFSTRYFLDGSDSESEDNSEVPLIQKPLDEKVSSKDNSEVSLITKPVDEKVSSKKRKTKDNSKMEKDKKMDTVSEKVSKKRKLNVSDSVNSKKHKHMCNGDNRDTIQKKKEKISTKDGGKDRNGVADGKSSIPTPKQKEKISTKDGGKDRNGIADGKSSIPTPKRLFGVGDSICRIAKKLSVSPFIPKTESQFQSQPKITKDSNSNSDRVDQTEESTKIPKDFNSNSNSNSDRVDQTEESTKIPKDSNTNSNSDRVDQTEESTKSDVSTKSATSDSSKEKFTALILKFTNLDSVPAVTELNEIFSKYGSVRESETEVLRKSNCAKVVFEEKSNAETAFSSAGKFSIFGPSLISYRLDYSPTPRKIYTRKGKKKNVGVIRFDD